MTNTNQTTQDCFDGSVAPYTPTQHAKVSPLKPVKLLALGTGEHGKTATFQFDGGWQREMDITGPVDAWHPLFMDLAYADSHALIEHAAFKTPLADGMVKVQDGPLSFVTETQTKRGKKLIFDYLDVPIEHYGPGRITGGKAALELVCCLKSGGGRGIDLPSIIQGASHAAVGSCLREVGKSGAAVGFLGTIAKLVSWAARNGDWEPVLIGKIAQHQQYQDKEEAKEAERAAKRIKRMVSARKAKQAVEQGAGVAA